CGLALSRAWRPGLRQFFREPDVSLALRLATGVAFILAGFVNVFLSDLGVGFFVAAGYTRALRLFIMIAEVMGGVTLLVPWTRLTLAAAAGLTIDMAGAVYTQMHLGEPLAMLAPPLVMLLRLAALVAVSQEGSVRRWV